MDKKQQEKFDKLIAEMREIFADVDDLERAEIHRKLMKGYCPTCANKLMGSVCYSCWESGGDF